MLALLLGRLWIAALFSAVMALGFTYLGYRAWKDMKQLEGPVRTLSIEEAVQRSASGKLLAVIEGARFRCGQALHDTLRARSTFVPIAGPGSDQVVLVAEYDASISCAAEEVRPLIGVVSALPDRMRTRLIEAGMVLPAGPMRHLCTYCSSTGSRTGVIVCGLLVLISLGLVPLVLVLRRSRSEAAPQSTTTRDIRLAGGLFLALGAVIGYMGAGWTVYGLIPLRVIGVIAALIGLAMVVAPNHPLVRERAERLIDSD